MGIRLLILLLVLSFTPCFPQENTERKTVLATVQRLFDAMARLDADGAKAVVLPEGRYFPVRNGAAGGGATLLEFANGLATRKEKLAERMSDPEVRVQGALATVWTPYDFHRNGKFSHCGVDSFVLVKTAGGWRIASLAYTVETTGCPARP